MDRPLPDGCPAHGIVGAGNSGELGALVGVLQGGAGHPGIGTLSWTSDEQDDQTGRTASTVDTTYNGPETAFVADPGSVVPAGDETVASGETPPDFSGRMATGPLASRSAAPVGPNLVTDLVDPVPAVDRHERGLSQAIDDRVIDADDETESSSRRRGRYDSSLAQTREYVVDEERDPEHRTHVAVAGLGSLPLIVPARGREGRGADLDALLAALPGSPAGEDIPAIVAGGNLATDDRSVMLARPESSEADGRPVADYLTTACVVVLGLGLTTGPIIPDLPPPDPISVLAMATSSPPGPCASSVARPRGLERSATARVARRVGAATRGLTLAGRGASATRPARVALPVVYQSIPAAR